MSILVFLSICTLTLPGVLSLCEDQRCIFTCRTERRGSEEDVSSCLELCMNRTCMHELEEERQSRNKSDESNTDSIVKSVKKFFTHPARWIPTVVGVVVGIGVIFIVVYYTRKSYLKRGRFSRYGFSRLSRRGKAPKLDSEVTELSEVRR